MPDGSDIDALKTSLAAAEARAANAEAKVSDAEAQIATLKLMIENKEGRYAICTSDRSNWTLQILVFTRV